MFVIHCSLFDIVLGSKFKVLGFVIGYKLLVIELLGYLNVRYSLFDIRYYSGPVRPLADSEFGILFYD